jgi:hypothetical protein
MVHLHIFFTFIISNIIADCFFLADNCCSVVWWLLVDKCKFCFLVCCQVSSPVYEVERQHDIKKKTEK